MSEEVAFLVTYSKSIYYGGPGKKPSLRRKFMRTRVREQARARGLTAEKILREISVTPRKVFPKTVAVITRAQE